MKSSVSIISFLFFIIVGFNSTAQLGFEYYDSINVMKNGVSLELAWAGGLNYPQVSEIDYDFDGDKDLFFFDRSQNNIVVLVQETIPSPHYRLEYNARLNFPPGLLYRSTLIDYDNDGKEDLFTYGIGGLKVYRNTGNITNGLQWVLVKNIVNSTYPSGTFNLFISSSDIPAIKDIDLDGDVDILTFHQGGSHVEYHQNQSMELYGIPDSIVFVQKNECWGKFSEDAVANIINLNDPNIPCVGGAISNPEGKPLNSNEEKAHSGSSLLAIDIDNSGVMDLVLGDVSYPTLTLLTNGGSAVNTDSPMISVDYNFPSNTTPANVTLFPASYYVDVNFDGIKDLIVAPNAANISVNEKSVSFFENLGSNSLPNFLFIEEDHFQNQMIEHGTGSVPIVVDFDEDGLNDLLVANFYRTQDGLIKESIVAYYQNTGTTLIPEYTFIDEDILGLLSQTYGLRSIPAFGDLDGDGDEDMLLGVENGTLVYYENSSTGSGSIFATAQPNYQDNLGVDMGAPGFAHPQIFDLNQDGLLDVIVGSRFGNLIYYENVGTISSPSFQLNNNALGGVDVTNGTPDGYAAPHFFLDSGVVKLFVGSVDGKLHYYDSISGNLGAGQNFNLVASDFLDIHVGGLSSFWVEDLDNDGRLNMLVGQELGGLYHFEVDPLSDASISENEISPYLDIYPNPTQGSITIETKKQMVSFEVINLSGEMVKANDINDTKMTFQLGDEPQGMYFVKVLFESGELVTKKIVKH